MKNYFAGILGIALLCSVSAFGLINGTVSPITDPIPFPNTFGLRVKGDFNAFCTAARVGPKTLLTAAHCVWDPVTRAIFPHVARGAKIQWTNVANPATILGFPDAFWNEVTVDDVYVNDQVWDKCRISGCGVADVWEKAPDVAVIRLVEEPLTGVFPAFVDFTYAGAGNSIIVGGYGCESMVGGPQYPVAHSRLKYGTVAIQGNSMFSWIPIGRPSEDFQFFSPGERRVAGAPSGCPGDSGGPVYRDDGRRNNIIGVNSRGVFDIMSGVSSANYFARVQSLESWFRSVNY